MTLGALAPVPSIAGPVLLEAPFLALPTPDSPAAFVLADMNADGITDIVAYSGSSLVFIPGHGDGTFESFYTISSRRYSETLAVGDFNEDGFPDIATISISLFIDDDPYPMAVDIFLGNGTGSFTLLGRTPYPDEGWPTSIAVADMDQDGHLDLVTTRSRPEVDILPGNGDGTFGAIRSVPSSGSAQQAMVADLDRNGISDMVVTRNSLRSFLVYLGTGGGAFATPIELPAGFGPTGVAVGDLNGDSNPDIAVANGGWFCAGIPPTITRDSTVTVYLGDGAGHFANAPSILTGDDPWSVSFADMDSDGIPDLVVGHDRWRGGVCWAGAPPMGDAAPFRKTAPAPAIEASIAEPGLSVFKGRGDGTFDPAPIDTWSDLGFLSSPADLNRDGRQDIVAVYSYHASLAVVLTRVDGSRAGGSRLHAQAIPQRVLVRDMDHDGRAEVIVNSYEGGTIELFAGSANRHSPSGVSSPAGQHPTFMASGDLDEDGIQDLVVADFGVVDSSTVASVEPGAVLTLRGRVDRTFTPFGTSVTIGNIVTVRIGDMNQDGHMDIVAGSFSPPTISVSGPWRRHIHDRVYPFVRRKLAASRSNR
ncbi:MAG TPA: VCBS repeat-containing protein [Candidatus Eisenbacteria bacterium]|nr:VCBS repeat-containing protein [Candidatus Eisenbacteria bacterium]